MTVTVTENDVGRRVVYERGAERESGVVTKFNDSYVFVRFSWGSAACVREDLSWEFPDTPSQVNPR